MLDETGNNGFNMKKLMRSYEVHFHLTGTVSKQNCRYWAPSGDNPRIIREKPLHDLCDCFDWCCNLRDNRTFLLQ